MDAPGGEGAYRVRAGPLKAEAVWSLEERCLVRRTGAAQARWPLADLTRMSLLRQPNRYGPDQRIAQLRFGRRTVAFPSQGWAGVGRPQDGTREFSAFVRRLAAEAAEAAPAARFGSGGRAPAAAGVYGAAALLGVALVVLITVAVSARQLPIGLDFGARLLFVLILLLAAVPWLPGPGAGAFDPRAIPDHLAPLG